MKPRNSMGFVMKTFTDSDILIPDRLLGNPYAQPPLPSDWEVRPTYPIRSVPYFLAPLWDEMSSRNLSKNKASPRNRMLQERSRHDEEVAKVSKQVKEKLKRARSAKGLLQDLEEEVRQFVKNWEERKKHMGKEGLIEPDSEDEEIVFVGRNGQMSDLRSPRLTDADLERNKLVFDSAADDHAASFGYDEFSSPFMVFKLCPMLTTFSRWLVHSIGVYYGLKTWSITVGDPARREAYVSIPRWKSTSEQNTSDVSQLPRPLWGMI